MYSERFDLPEAHEAKVAAPAARAGGKFFHKSILSRLSEVACFILFLLNEQIRRHLSF
jgi:hypothetical protein